MDLKQKLASLIDAYADAKRSNNETLIQFAASQLQEFLSTYEVVASNPPEAGTPDSEQK